MQSLPNILTLARLLMALGVGVFATWPGDPLWVPAVACLVAAALTDFFDGWLARRFKAETLLGRVLDPLADKVLVLTALVALTAGGALTGLHALAVILILLRELVVAGLRDILARGGGTLPVSGLARIKTAVQMAAAGLLLGSAAWPALPYLRETGLAVLWTAVVLTLWTGAAYIRSGLRQWHHAVHAVARQEKDRPDKDPLCTDQRTPEKIGRQS